MRSSFVSSLVLSAIVTTSTITFADTISDAAAAEALFEGAKSLMRQGRYDEACPKLVESQRLDAGIGTLLALGLCYEKSGKTASAWATYREVVAAAQQAHQTDRKRIAQEHANLLSKRLAYLTVIVPQADGALASFVVERDGVVLTGASFGVAVPVNPGEHILIAKADGKKPAQVRVVVEEAARVSAELPLLEDEPAPALAAEPQAESTKEERGQRSAPVTPDSRSNGTTHSAPWKAVGYAIGGVGVLGVGLGVAFGLTASSAKERADCDAAGFCDPDELATARHHATVATVGFAVGGALIAGGLGLVLLSPNSSRPSTPSVALRGTSLVIAGAW